MEKDKESSFLKSWADLSQQAKGLLDAVRSGRAKEVEQASAEVLWAAEGIVRKTNGTEDKNGLAGRCVELDNGAALLALLSRVDFAASKAESQDDWNNFKAGLAKMCVAKRARKALLALCETSDIAAWSCAKSCTPKKSDNSFQRASLASRDQEGWSAGYAMCMDKGVEGRSLSKGASSDMALSAIKAGLKWESESFEPGIEQAQKAAFAASHAMVGAQLASGDLAFALLACAAKPSGLQVQAGKLAVEVANACKQDLSCAPPEAFGYEAGSRPFKPFPYGSNKFAPVALFGQRLDPLWAIAAQASTLGSVQALSDAMESLPADSSARPSMAPSVAGLTHPLAKVWDVWHNSKKAGFVLPKKVLSAARFHFESVMKSWTERVDSSSVAEWEKQGEAMLASLFNGMVPDRFEGFDQKPSTELGRQEFLVPLSPLAWAWAYDRGSIGVPKLDESGFVAIALAQDRLGYGFDSSVKQAKLASGQAPDASWLAKAQKALLATHAQQSQAYARPRARL